VSVGNQPYESRWRKAVFLIGERDNAVSKIKMDYRKKLWQRTDRFHNPYYFLKLHYRAPTFHLADNERLAWFNLDELYLAV
jgi:hypothetical protein